MPTHIAFLRAVNVTGTGKLQMAPFRARCETAGFANVRSYIASGNILVDSRLAASTVQRRIEALATEMVGKHTAVFVRSPRELESALRANPFRNADPARVMVLFLAAPPAAAALVDWPTPGDEELRLVGRELFIHFPRGQGQSRLKIPFADVGTGRNLNTVRAVLELAGA